jgi:aquaporin Z
METRPPNASDEGPPDFIPPAPPPRDVTAAPAAPAGIADTRSVVVPDHGQILAAELIGTAVLVLCGAGALVLVPEFAGRIVLVGLTFGFTFMALTYVLAPVGAGQLNPALTLGLLLANKVTTRHAVYAWIGQVIGGVAGAAILFGIANGRDDFVRGGFGSNGWHRSFTEAGHVYGLGSVIVVEVVFTALLVFVVLGTTNRRFSTGFGGLAAGVTLALIHFVTIPVDNTGVNPARSLGTALFADTDPNALGQVWAFIIFPLIGALVGVIAWLLVDDSRLEETRLDTDFLRAARDSVDDLVD